MSRTISSSTGLRVSMLTGPGVKPTMDGGEIRIYSGIRPAAADDSIGAAVLLCTVRLNGTNGIELDASTPGLLMKPVDDDWTGNSVSSGTATWFRICLPADVGGASPTAPRIQGTVGVVGADLNLDTVALTSGLPCPVASFSIGIYAQLP